MIAFSSFKSAAARILAPLAPGRLEALDGALAELGPGGVIVPRLLPAAAYEAAGTPDEIRVWLHHRGFYAVPTVELVEALRVRIAGRRAIEIGAGHGAIGRALGIPVTDLRAQEAPSVAALYESLGQPVIRYPSDVERLEAMGALLKYKPEVVIGSWVTSVYRSTIPGAGVHYAGIVHAPGVQALILVGRGEGGHLEDLRMELQHAPGLAAHWSPVDGVISRAGPGKAAILTLTRGSDTVTVEG